MRPVPGELPPWLDGGAHHDANVVPETQGRRRWWPRWARGRNAGAVGAVVAAATLGLLLLLVPRGHHGALPHPAADALPAAGHPPAAWPGPLPYPVLIADQGHHRLLEVTPDRRVLWQYQAAAGGAPVPAGSVSFSPDGRFVVATDDRLSLIERIDYQARSVTWRFGGAGVLNAPTRAHLLADGDTIVADDRNCRELTIDGTGKVVATWGSKQTGYCLTDTAAGRFGYPAGDEPQSNGDTLMAFGSGDRIALLSPTGSVLWDVASPNLYGGYVAAAAMGPDGQVLVTGRGNPGAVVLFDPATGRVAWQYHVASGAGALADPTQAGVLPGGDVLVADTGNNRVIVIDPHTDAIVWSYTDLLAPTGVALDTWRGTPG